MSLKDTEMHVVSMFGAGLLSAALIVPVVFLTDAAEAKRSSIDDNRTVLEATIAYKKSPTKQPQKKTTQVEDVKPVGVSHDENKKVGDGTHRRAIIAIQPKA